MKKAFIFLTAILLACILPISAAASGATDTDEYNGSCFADGNSESTGTADSGGKESTDTQAAPSSAGNDNGGANTEDAEGGVTDTAFTLLFEGISERTGEIFCALTLIGTAILSFAYKRGLLPLVKGSLHAIGEAVGSLKESAKNDSAVLGEQSEKITDGLTRAEAMLVDLSARLCELEEALSGVGELRRSQNATEIILACQVDALSEVFMSSSLPEYRKAALGEKLTKMREALKNADNEGNGE